MTRIALVTFSIGISFLAMGCGEGYGTKLDYDGSEVYYTKNVTEAEAKKLGDFLKQEGYFANKKVTVQLDSADGVYLFRMVMIENYKEIDGYPGAHYRLGAYLSAKVFDGKPVAMHFTDNRLKIIEVLDAEKIGSMIAYGKCEMMFSHGATKEEAKKVGDILKNIKYFGEKRFTVILRKKGDIYQLLFVVDVEKIKQRPALKQLFESGGRLISKNALEEKPVEVHLIDSKLNTVEVLKTRVVKNPGKPK